MRERNITISPDPPSIPLDVLGITNTVLRVPLMALTEAQGIIFLLGKIVWFVYFFILLEWHY